MGANCACEPSDKKDEAVLVPTVAVDSQVKIDDDQPGEASPLPREDSNNSNDRNTAAPESAEEAPAAQADGGRRFTYVVEKPGNATDKTLSIDAKHVKGVLEVIKIFPDGDVFRRNEEITDPDYKLLEKDVILRVNDIADDDIKMVAECNTMKRMTMEVLRGMRAEEFVAERDAKKAPGS